MHPARHFRHCPSCAAPLAAEQVQPVTCQGCGFTLFLSVTPGTGAFVSRPDGRVLFIRRAFEPEKGKLGIPGGFADEGETVEAALQRECREEVGMAVSDLQYLCSFPNQYTYRGVTYPVLDFYFTATAGTDAPCALDGVTECLWLDPGEIDTMDLAFPSLVRAVGIFLERRRKT